MREQARARREHCGEGATAESAAVRGQVLERAHDYAGTRAAELCARSGTTCSTFQNQGSHYSRRAQADQQRLRPLSGRVRAPHERAHGTRNGARRRAYARLHERERGERARKKERDRPTLPTERWRNLRRAVPQQATQTRRSTRASLPDDKDNFVNEALRAGDGGWDCVCVDGFSGAGCATQKIIQQQSWGNSGRLSLLKGFACILAMLASLSAIATPPAGLSGRAWAWPQVTDARSPWLRCPSFALLVLLFLGVVGGGEHVTAWGSRASAASLAWLRGGSGNSTENQTMPAGFWDLPVWRAPPPEFTSGNASAAHAAVRASAFACNTSFFDGIAVAPPLKVCSAAELAAAITKSTRLHGDVPPVGDHVGPPLIVPGCRLEWYSGARVCDLLQAIGGFSLVGDSLMRHMGQTIIALATGGNLGAAVSAHMGNTSFICECDGAYDDGHARRFPGDHKAPFNALCRKSSLAFLNLAALRTAWPDFCPAWGAKSYLGIADSSALSHKDFADYSATAHAAYQLTSGGLHSPTGRLDPGAARHYFGALAPGARVYLFATLHAPGSNKSPQYLYNFGHDATSLYNELIREHAEELNATIFDAYAITYDAPSIDGQHYYQATNVDLAQLLLNLIATLHRERPPPSLQPSQRLPESLPTLPELAWER